VCFIGFIAIMKIVKRILGNNNFDLLSSSLLTCSSSCRFIYFYFFTTQISKFEIKNKDLLHIYFFLRCIAQKMIRHVIYLYFEYMIFISLSTSFLPK